MSDARNMATKQAPGRTYATPVGFFVEARRDPLGHLQRAAGQFGDLVLMGSWPFVVHFVFDPDHIKHVLQENHRNYWKGDLIAKEAAHR